MMLCIVLPIKLLFSIININLLFAFLFSPIYRNLIWNDFSFDNSFLNFYNIIRYGFFFSFIIIVIGSVGDKISNSYCINFILWAIFN